VRYGLLPCADDAQALEVAALASICSAAYSRHFARKAAASSLSPTLPNFFSDHQFDRQAVAIPARHVGRVEAGQQLRLHHHCP
jgi:hypothetical protein